MTGQAAMNASSQPSRLTARTEAVHDPAYALVSAHDGVFLGNDLWNTEQGDLDHGQTLSQAGLGP